MLLRKFQPAKRYRSHTVVKFRYFNTLGGVVVEPIHSGRKLTMNHLSAVSTFASVPNGPLGDNARRRATALERIVKARRRRQQFFPTHLFCDPAWDMLLKLAQAELDQQRVTVSELCIAAGTPYTTALRYIQAMVDEGLVSRLDDPLDGRRKFLSLSTEASIQMSAYLDVPTLSDAKAA